MSLKEIEELICGIGKDRVLVGIDGRCGAGKTTLSRMIAERFGMAVVHADDFFLPPEMRTKERLDEPGGNMQRERLEREILLPFTEGKCGAEYRPFVCKTGGFGEPVSVSFEKGLVVEGSYSLHPELAGYYDFTIFVDCDGETQIKRLEKREGEEKLTAFIQKWIPMEEKYFAFFGIKESADSVFRTDTEEKTEKE